MNLRDLHRKYGPFLKPLGSSYAFMMRKRAQAYNTGRIRSYRPSVPTISIGNIAWGGTGKTPLTAWMLIWARKQNIRAVVLTRGYGGSPGKTPLLVKADTPAESSGDEPLMLARQFPEASILVCPKRADGARFAEKELQPGLLLLDDGMQHLAVERDIDMVLLRPEDLTTEWNRVIPSGSWREGASALARADVFLIRAGHEEFTQYKEIITQRLAHLEKPVFSFSLEVTGLTKLFPVAPASASSGLRTEADVSGSEYEDKPYALLSGVGNPASVEKNATMLMGRPPVQHFEFQDHHSFSVSDLQALVKLLPVSVPIVCTDKDAVKLEAFGHVFANTPVWVMKTMLSFGPARNTHFGFEQWWSERWQNLAGSILSGGTRSHG